MTMPMLMKTLRGSTAVAGVLVVMLALGMLLDVTQPFSASAQEKEAQEQTPLTVGEIQRLRRQAEQAGGLEEDVKAKILETYDQALGQLETAAVWSEKAAAYDRARQEAPKSAETLEKQLKELLPEPTKELPKDVPLGQLEQRLREVKLELDTSREEVDKLEAKVERRRERRKKVPELLAAAKQRLAEAREQEAVSRVGEGPPELTNARGILLEATILATEAEIAGLKRELPSYEAREKLLTLRIDRALRISAAREKEVEVWQEKLRESRREEAERAAQAAKEALLEATGASPGIRQFAEELAAENAALAEQRTGPEGILYKLDGVAQRLGEVNGLLTKVEADFSSVEKRVEAGSLTAALGVMLRHQRVDLPELTDRRVAIRARRQEIESAQLKIIEFQEERQAVSDGEGIVSEKMKGVDPSLRAYQRRRMEQLLRELLWTKRSSLQSLVNDYTTYFEKLMELDVRERALVDKVQEFASFIDERILWVRSAQPLREETISGVVPGVRWLTSAEHWGQVVDTLRADLSARFAVYVLASLLLISALVGRRRTTVRLQGLHEQAHSPRCTDFTKTAEALLLTVLAAALLPFFVGLLGWRLRSLGGSTDFVYAIGSTLEFTAVLYLSLEIPRQVFRPGGLGRIHFGWPADWMDGLYKLYARALVVGLPALFVIAATEAQADEGLKATLGRITFLVLIVATGLMMWWTLRSILRRTRASETSEGGGTPLLFQRLLYLYVLGVPGAIVVVAALGYYYGALDLGLRFHATTCLVIAVLTLQGMILRWLLLTRRRLAIEENRKKWEALAKRVPAQEDGEAPEPEEELDLAKVQVQTNRLIRGVILLALVVGVWLIWVEVVAALGILREVELWHTIQEVSQVVTDAEGRTSVQTVEQFRAITLADLLQALVILMMTILATRNLPGTLQAVLLQRTRLGTGEIHAISTIVQYTVAIIGGSAIFRIIGIGWGNIQWLIAALGVGIGFGLQEIVANFISGLILLFERPIRVGDTVTVGDMSGVVSRIRIRATAITGWDRKELIVPNKEFITGRLVNWTLSDTVLRVSIPVGVAYGSDTKKAKERMLAVAKANEKVLHDPAPSVVFMGFGASSLDFDLRAFTRVDTMISVRDELNMAVDEAFREAGIEIAFPQQDIHIRSVEDTFLLTTEETEEKPT